MGVGGGGVEGEGFYCDELRRNLLSKQPARKTVKLSESVCLLSFVRLVFEMVWMEKRLNVPYFSNAHLFA